MTDDSWDDDSEMVDAVPPPGDITSRQISDWSQDGDDGDWGDDGDEMDGHDAVLQAGIVRTPAHIKNMARQNAEELKMTRLFQGCVELTGTKVHVLVFIDLHHVPLITEEQKEVWGLSPADRYIVFKLSCGAYYLQDGEQPTVETGCAEAVNAQVEIKPFALAWTIRERIQNTLLSRWPPELEDHETFSVDELLELMQDYDLSYSVCYNAMKQRDWSQADTMMAFQEPKLVKKIRQGLPSVVDCNQELTSMWDFDDERNDFAELDEKEAAETPEDSGATTAGATTKKRGFLDRLRGRAGAGAGETRTAEGEFIGPATLAGRTLRAKDGLRTLSLMCKHNYMARLGWFGFNVLMNGNKYCMICNAKMPFVGLKPGVCQKRMCEFGFQNLGLGFSLSNEIIQRGNITDLLISFLVAACHADRVDIFFPTGVAVGSAEEGNEDSFMNGEAIDVAKLQSVLNLLPTIDEMIPWALEGDSSLKAHLHEVHPLAYGLLCWIITSNRTHLRELKPGEIVEQLNQASHQFALCSATPEREQIFQNLKKEYGSFWTYHGSGIGNWHSILRMGLKNYSGTNKQQNGAAYGSGVYLALHAHTSVSYSGRGGSVWPKTRFPSGFSCMAICEIINHPSLEEKSAFGGIYVIPQEEYIVTRVLLLFQGSVQNVHSRKLKVPELVRGATE